MRFLIIPCLLALSVSAFAEEPEDAAPEKAPMPKAEFFSKYRALFNQADTDFNGQLTKHELAMSKFERQKDGHKKKFKNVDTNFDGYLSYNEIRVWHENYTEQRVSELDHRKAQLLARYDLDKNGTISPYELDEVFEVQAENFRDKVDVNATVDMKTKDTDDSGSVSLDEYLDSKAPKKRTRQTPTGPRAIMTPDMDWDGIITRLELDEFLTEIFKANDKNEDGELSPGEQKNLALIQIF